MNDNFKRMLKLAVELDKNVSGELSKIASELIKLSDLEHDFAAEVARRDSSPEFGLAREVASLVRIERRAASVGWAVNTGLTSKFSSHFFISETVTLLAPVFSAILSIARVNQDPPFSRAAAKILER